MKLFSTPYRWTYDTWWRNLDCWRWDIINGVGNCATFFAAVWKFRSFDWTGMVNLLEVAANEMKRTQDLGRHTTSQRDARRLLIVRELCRRLIADEYSEGLNPNWDGRYRHREAMAAQDVNYLCQTLRFVRHWWS